MHKWTRNILGTVAIALALVAMTLFSGCSGKKGKVSGKVKVGDKTVKYGTVSFLNSADSSKTPGAGSIEKDGTYTIGTPLEPGKYIITVSSPKPPQGGSKGGGPDPTARAADKGMADRAGKTAKEMAQDTEWKKENYVPIPDDYTDPTKKKITKEVAPGDNTIDITIPE
jgi:hypothetical protein